MFGPYDIALIGAFLLLCWIAMRAGFWLSALLTAGLIGAALFSLGLGTPAYVLATIVGWLALSLLVAWLRRRVVRKPATTGSKTAAVLLSTAQFALVALLATGAATSLSVGPQELIRGAAAYPAIANVGNHLGSREFPDSLQQVSLPPFPDPLEQAPDQPPVSIDPPSRPIDWAEVYQFDNAITRVLNGYTVPTDRAPLSFEVGGTIRAVNVTLGETFTAGDILAELDPTPIQIALDQQRAALIEAEATAREANLSLSRQRQLRQSGTVSEAALDRAVAAAESAQSRLEIARAAIRQAEDRLDDVELRAPFDGVVDERMIEPAQTVQPGQTAFEVQDIHSGFQIEMLVPETLIGKIEAGVEHEVVILNGTDHSIRARVHEVGSRANASTGFPVSLNIIDDHAFLRAGMTVEIHLALPSVSTGVGSGDLSAVPYTAVLPGDRNTHVSFVFNHATGSLERREITVAGREGNSALISSGLEPGDIVAIRGLPFLNDGDAVSLRGVGIARYDN